MGTVKTVAIVGGIALGGLAIWGMFYYGRKRTEVAEKLNTTLRSDLEQITANPDNFINASSRTGVVTTVEASGLNRAVRSGDIHTAAYIYRPRPADAAEMGNSERPTL